MNQESHFCCGDKIYLQRWDNPMGCCGDKKYFTSSQRCCGTTLMSHDDERDCCNLIHPYDPATEICCGTQVYDDHSNTRCCGNDVFDISSQTCCSDGFSFQVHDGINRQCCGVNGLYDSSQELCCEGIDHYVGSERIEAGRAVCCGMETMDPTEEICCDGNTHPQDSFAACCGSRTFNIISELCYRGEVITKERPGDTECCGIRPVFTFNPDHQTCCDGTVLPVGHGECCTRGTAFNRASQSCCSGRLSDIPTIAGLTDCCGHQSYLLANQMCCQGQLYDREAGSQCCGNGVYNNDTHLCCNGNKVNKLSSNHRCCDNVSYDSQSDACCNGEVVSGDGECCYHTSTGITTYNPETQTCCQTQTYGRVYDTPNAQDLCCQDRLPSELQLCNGNEIIEKEDVHDDAVCCVSTGCHTYNTTNFVCELGGSHRGVVARQETEEICGNVIINIESEMCCDMYPHSRQGSRNEERQCCGFRAYSSDTESCYLTIIYPFPEDFAGKCGDTLYDTRSHTCYKHSLIRELEDANIYPDVCIDPITSELRGYRPNEHECCGGQKIVAGQTCCNGQVMVTPGTALRTGECCLRVDGSEQGYNPDTHLCCDGEVHDITVNGMQCCGTEAHDPHNPDVICCDSYLHSTAGGRTYCTGRIAHKIDEIVCEGTVHQATSGTCCGRRLINDEDHICCRGIVYDRDSADTQCCGGVAFDPSTQMCCVDSLYDLGSPAQSCCGTVAYNPTTQTCQEVGDLHYVFQTAGTVTCGDDGSHDASQHTCCDGILHKNIVDGECCGYKIIRDPVNEFCCGGEVMSGKASNYGCCGGKTYNSLWQTCCGGKIMWAYTRRHKCCNDSIVARHQICESS